jgi:hypothetical protein
LSTAASFTDSPGVLSLGGTEDRIVPGESVVKDPAWSREADVDVVELDVVDVGEVGETGNELCSGSW